MRAYCAFVLAALFAATAAPAAEEVGSLPKLRELLAQGYDEKASGELVMTRKLVPPMDQGIFVHRYYDPSCIRAPIATMQGGVDTCEIGDVWASKARFHRMAKGESEFVCILYGSGECHRVH
mgnify:CR=1 FL=1